MIEKANSSPCATCTVRDLSFCGALIGSRQKPALPPSSWRQVHRSERARNDICNADNTAGDAQIICHGWAARVIKLADGRRQIISFLIPGDLVSATAPFSKRMEFSVQAITELRYSAIDRTDFVAVVSRRPELFDAWKDIYATRQDVADQLIIDLRSRRADERIARLILHLMERLAARGLVKDQCFGFPLDELHLSDATGLTPSLVKRVLDEFRADNLIERADGIMKIVNLKELRHRARLG